ncbi:MAG TPA: threonine/serine exporter family protein [Paludibacter sp.]|nr:threonine/serine exporter family protein [Paludibacter sp.]
MELLSALSIDFALAFCVAFCWGILFGTPWKALLMTGLLGGFGHGIRFILLQSDFGLIASTLIASVSIGLVGIYAAHKVHNPPVVITMPACITMIPGLYAYRSMLAGIKLSDQAILEKEPDIIPTIAHNAVLTFSLLFTLAVGISISALLFRNKSVKEIRFDKNRLKSKGK